jgi:2,3-bisphosphoglycerate-independent phosphoglycerate mutase
VVETKTDKAQDSKFEDKTKTIEEIDREKLEKKFSKVNKEKLN